MNNQFISSINGIDIVTVEQDGEIFVPLKPVCDALGIDGETQREMFCRPDAKKSKIIKKVA